jgi:DNA-binding CsgD family transcriptional regulator
MPPAEVTRKDQAAETEQDAVHRNAAVERGRRSFAGRAWNDSYTAFSLADQAEPLAGADLELLATAAAMLGRGDEQLAVLERAHHAHLRAGETLGAVRCAFWLGMFNAERGERALGAGWLGRARRLLEREDRDCVERGYLLVTTMAEHEQAGDVEAAVATTVDAARIGERFGDGDLVALTLYERGRLLLEDGRVDAGLALFDEVMVAVCAGELSPMVTGILYCSVIASCQQTFDLRRAREWTAALGDWCDEQPDMVALRGRCLVHRAEIMQVDGAWPAALKAAQRAGDRILEEADPVAAGEAFYRQGEIRRLRGEHVAAERAYREASRRGREPQPGLSLLRLAEGDAGAAAAAIRRVVDETGDPLRRVALLPAFVEITLAVGDLEAARRAQRELDELTDEYRGGMLGAMVAHARGAVALAEGDTTKALVTLREAAQLWQELGARYESARARELVGLACRQLGDADAAEMELESAYDVFRQLGAAPDLGRIGKLIRRAGPKVTGGLTGRELEIVRLVATGRTNRAIAEELVISEKTVARHMSNVFGKLGVSSRSAVTAFGVRARPRVAPTQNYPSAARRRFGCSARCDAARSLLPCSSWRPTQHARVARAATAALGAANASTRSSSEAARQVWRWVTTLRGPVGAS